MTGGAAPLTIAYDPLGRIAKTTSGTTGTDFLYDGSRLIAEYNSANGALLRSYVHGPGTDDPLLWLEGGPSSPYASGIGNDPRWLYRDRQGSVIGVAGANGIITPYTYGPYGEPQSWAGSRFRYTGQIALPEAQLYHYKARAYDSIMGRFLQTDPIGYGDGMNIYAYVHGDPVNGVDPEGTSTTQWGFNVDLIFWAFEWGHYKETDDDPISNFYPKNDGNYLTGTNGGLQLGIVFNVTTCNTCVASDLAGDGKQAQLGADIINFGFGKTNGKDTQTVGAGPDGSLPVTNDTYTYLFPSTGPLTKSNDFPIINFGNGTSTTGRSDSDSTTLGEVVIVADQKGGFFQSAWSGIQTFFRNIFGGHKKTKDSEVK